VAINHRKLQEKKRHFWCGQANHHFEVIEQNDFSFSVLPTRAKLAALAQSEIAA
jgi:hypothetical protein